MKKIIAIMLCLVMMFALVACGQDTPSSNDPPANAGNSSAPASDDPFADGPTVNLIFANTWTDSLYYYEFGKEVCAAISEKTNGKININCQFDSNLGGDADLIESCLAGDIAFIHVTSSALVPYVKEAAIYEMPMLFASRDEARAASKLFVPYVEPYFNDVGLGVITSQAGAFRALYSNVEINSFEDFKGLKLRVMDNKYHTEFWNAVGASPTPLSISELIVSLQQGVVDANEQPLTSANAFKEVQDYIYDTNTTAYCSHILVNKATWDSLPAAYQEAIQEMFDEITTYIHENFNATQEAMLANLEGWGIEYVEISDELRQQLVDASASSYDLLREDIDPALVDKMFECIEQVQ